MKKKLIEYRNEIDKIDNSILALIEHRCDIVKLVGIEKNQHTSPIYVPSRENQIFSRLIEQKKNLSEENIKAIYTEIISSCRALEKRIKILSLNLLNESIIPKIFGNAVDSHNVYELNSLKKTIHNYDYLVLEYSEFKKINSFILNYEVISTVSISETEYYIINLSLEGL